MCAYLSIGLAKTLSSSASVAYCSVERGDAAYLEVMVILWLAVVSLIWHGAFFSTTARLCGPYIYWWRRFSPGALCVYVNYFVASYQAWPYRGVLLFLLAVCSKLRAVEWTMPLLAQRFFVAFRGERVEEKFTACSVCGVSFLRDAAG